MKEKEYILCSAIKIDNIIVCGRRHKDCYKIYSEIRKSCGDYSICDQNRNEQGFLTSENRYVDRKEAWNIAKDNNQIKYGLKASEDGINSELISENLYFDDI